MSFAPGNKIWIDGPARRSVTLGALLKSGGAGSVFLIRELPAQVAKIYHRELSLETYERKLKAMLLLTPNLPDINEAGKRFVQIAWPQAILRDDRGRFIGFTMPSLDIKATSELEYIMQERQARAEGLPIGLGTKITLAANLSAVIAELHRQHHYVVDMKPVNLRFYRQSLYMAMLDCDGFSIQGQGERFEAPQFTPDYLAPEFQVKGIDAAGEEQQDRFALAVVIFQLLNFGIHPFTGKPTSDQVPTDIPGRIAARCYAYGLRPHKAIVPSMVSGHEAINVRLRHLFDRAFESTGLTRPSAGEWASALKLFAQKSTGSLIVCKTNKEHQHFVESHCAACNRDALLKKARQAPRNPMPATTRVPVQRAAAQKRPGRAPATAAKLPRVTVTPRYQTLPSYPKSLPTRRRLTAQYTSNQPLNGKAVFWFIFIFLMMMVLRFGSCDQSRNRTEIYDSYSSENLPARTSNDPFLDAGSPADTAAVVVPHLDETTILAKTAADAIASGDVNAGIAALSAMQATASTHKGPNRASAARHNQAMAEYLSANNLSSPANIEARQVKLRKQLGEILLLDPLATDTSVELGWFYVMNREMPDAQRWFTQTIWAKPMHPLAWYGLGVSRLEADNDETIVGMFTIAELLLDQTNASQSMRSRIEYLQYQLPADEQKNFLILKARAQQVADEMRSDGISLNTDVWKNIESEKTGK